LHYAKNIYNELKQKFEKKMKKFRKKSPNFQNQKNIIKNLGKKIYLKKLARQVVMHYVGLTKWLHIIFQFPF